MGEAPGCTSVVVAAELRYGAAKKASPRLSRQLEAILEVLPLEVPADRSYAMLRADLERSGRVLGPNDVLVAAQALALGCVLVTDNERELARVPGLRTENWLRSV